MWNWIEGFIMQYPNVLVISVASVGAIAFTYLFWSDIKDQDWFQD